MRKGVISKNVGIEFTVRLMGRLVFCFKGKWNKERERRLVKNSCNFCKWRRAECLAPFFKQNFGKKYVDKRVN